MGVTLRVRGRLQINLAVSQVVDIKQVATFPDIIFPIMWFEDVSIMTLRALIESFVINSSLFVCFLPMKQFKEFNQGNGSHSSNLTHLNLVVDLCST